MVVFRGTHFFFSWSLEPNDNSHNLVPLQYRGSARGMGHVQQEGSFDPPKKWVRVSFQAATVFYSFFTLLAHPVSPS